MSGSGTPQPQSDLTETAMSRSIKFVKAGGPEVLEFVEVQVPAPGPNEVRIKVKAIGINRAEAMWRVDDYIERVKFPAGLGYEAAGTVDAVGKDVGGFAVGDDPHRVQHALADDRLQRRQHEKDPKDVEHGHEILLVVIIRLRQSRKVRNPGCLDRRRAAIGGGAEAVTDRRG